MTGPLAGPQNWRALATKGPTGDQFGSIISYSIDIYLLPSRAGRSTYSTCISGKRIIAVIDRQKPVLS